MKLVHGSEPGWSALFSDDEKHRFMLERTVPMDPDVWARDPCGDLVSTGRRLVSCGLNPSTADAFRNDPTVRKEIGFAQRWGCSLYVKVNVYAWRETKPRYMWAARDRGEDIVGVGSEPVVAVGNDEAIRSALVMLKNDGGIALAAWGVHAEPIRALKLLRIAAEVGVEWMCLGTNKDGSPKHSLYPPYSTPLVPWVCR